MPMNGNSSKGMAKPPEGVISGDSIPRENEEFEMEKSKIDELVGIMKTMEAYENKAEDELREIAKEKLA